MADRIPLEKPSLSHTSQEPEGLAWAQIGTNLANGGKQASEKSAVQDATADKEPEEDAGSEVDLRVDEDAQPEEENEAVADVSMEATEESEEAGEKEGESGDGKSEEGQGDVDDTSAGSKKRTAEDEEEEKKKTNSHNPRRIKARVFVGHLNTDRCSREDVEKLFEPHGKILGVSLQKGYGFVQFEDEEGARRAVKEVHGQHFFGMKIVVDKPVALKRLLGEDPDSFAPWPDEPNRPMGARRSRYPHDHDRFNQREMMDRYARLEELERFARLEELERYYYDRYVVPPPPPPPPMPPRDYDRGFGRYPSPVDRHVDRHRHPDYERERGERSYDRYGGPAYDRPRDDPYERRELLDRRDREPAYGRRERTALLEKEAGFELRDAAPFERHDVSPFERRDGHESYNRYGPIPRRM